jgi:Protein of unknown function (DUF2796)
MTLNGIVLPRLPVDPYMLTKMSSLVSSTLLCMALPLDLAYAQEAHVHGVGHLNIAIEGSRLEIEFEGPGDNVVGFEHAAETAEERSAVRAAEQRLRQPARLLVLPQAAGCALRETDLDIPAGATTSPAHGHKHGHGHAEDHDDHKHDHKNGHDDWRVRYVFACTAPAALSSIRAAPWFTAFPNTLELRVQVISGFGQSGFTLTPARSRIMLRTQ